jgi:hypothetical protein
MKTYEIVIVTKEYRSIEVQAKDETEAKDLVWDKVIEGYTTTTRAYDYDTELYVEQVIEGEAP